MLIGFDDTDPRLSSEPIQQFEKEGTFYQANPTSLEFAVKANNSPKPREQPFRSIFLDVNAGHDHRTGR